MRQFLKSGSVRGVRSNPHPYRDPALSQALRGSTSVSPRAEGIVTIAGGNGSAVVRRTSGTIALTIQETRRPLNIYVYLECGSGTNAPVMVRSQEVSSRIGLVTTCRRARR